MANLSEKVQDFVRTQRLGYVATVCPDGTPNLSPKGTLTVWDAEHLIFADLNSPGTVRNLLSNPAIEINVVDEFIRKGYRFKGKAQVLRQGALFEEMVAFYSQQRVFEHGQAHPGGGAGGGGAGTGADLAGLRAGRERGAGAGAMGTLLRRTALQNERIGVD